MSSQDEALHHFRFRLGSLLVLRNTLAALALWAFLAGVLVLALRAALGVSRWDLLWGTLSLPLALVPAFWLAGRRLPSLAALRVVLDHHGACGGLLMASDEVPLGGWSQDLPELQQPRLRWRSGRAWALLGGGLAFLALGFLLPQGFADMGNGPGLEVSRETARLSRQLDVLKEESILEPKRADDLKTKVEQLRREAQGRDPVKTLEALDHLEDVLTKTAKEAAESAARKNEALARTETLAETLKKKSKDLDAKALAEGMSQLARLSREAAAENAALEQKLDPETLDALKNSTLTPEQLQKLLDALKDCKGDLSKKLGKLARAGLIDPELLELCEKAGECDCEGLALYLKSKGCCNSLCEAACDRPGRGGVNRGPGAAEMAWKDPTSEDGFKFKEEALPPSSVKALKDSITAGLSAGAPGKTKPDGSASAGALAGAKTGDGSASTQVVLPRHRQAVERYFERAAKGSR